MLYSCSVGPTHTATMGIEVAIVKLLMAALLVAVRYPYDIYPSVQAPYNWFGRGDVPYVAGRIWERRDDDNLIQVEYQPPLKDNSSVLEGELHFCPSSIEFVYQVSFAELHCLDSL